MFPPEIRRGAWSAVCLTVFAGLLFAAGTGRAYAPGQACTAQLVPGPANAAAQDDVARDPLDPGQRALSAYFSRRYMVAPEAVDRWVATAYRAAGEVSLDPLLVLAVISVESRFNPVAESAMGAKGLMQIIPRFHRDKLDELGGEDAALDPESNILVGARILREYVRRTGTLQSGLQYYNGAMADDSAQYAQKVLAERGRLERMLRAAPKDERTLAQNTTTGS